MLVTDADVCSFTSWRRTMAMLVTDADVCSLTSWRRTMAMRGRVLECASGQYVIIVIGQQPTCGSTAHTAVTCTTMASRQLYYQATPTETVSHVCLMLIVERWRLERTERWSAWSVCAVFIWMFVGCFCLFCEFGCRYQYSRLSWKTYLRNMWSLTLDSAHSLATQLRFTAGESS